MGYMAYVFITRRTCRPHVVVVFSPQTFQRSTIGYDSNSWASCWGQQKGLRMRHMTGARLLLTDVVIIIPESE